MVANKVEEQGEALLPLGPKCLDFDLMNYFIFVCPDGQKLPDLPVGPMSTHSLVSFLLESRLVAMGIAMNKSEEKYVIVPLSRSLVLKCPGPVLSQVHRGTLQGSEEVNHHNNSSCIPLCVSH